ncbi:respiratory chain complex I subunit 1 family protein [Miltoncostaea marina]|uniref:respiratory chain complex I subunit 1 family protein n=1 Tax=Miltoncostaea marina TaxID=2843215 RepID=UPI001C3CDE88|nr:NADH-quinone oxidoreductase subunit H [Miltoncostaea marina]
MRAADAAATAAQMAGLALAPLLPGGVQALKARLQGRRGPGVLQPYRELRRLWRRGTVDPEGSGAAYRWAPVAAAAALAVCVLVVPVGAWGTAWPAGHDALLLVGLLALARIAVALSAWDTGGGFGLMGASRELAFAVVGEALLVLVVLLAAIPAGSTDLRAMWEAGAGTGPWEDPARWCAALAMGLVVLLETGRQPIDNPDTHLELTMVHEGPLLEYAGRDLALLQWTAAARHWVVLVVAASLALPHPGDAAGGLAALALGVLALVGGLALVESWQAKMRLLRVPPTLLAGVAVALAGVVSAAWGAG